MTAEQVAEFIGAVSTAWVRRYVPGKLVLGHRTVRWYRDEVERWLATTRQSTGRDRGLPP